MRNYLLERFRDDKDTVKLIMDSNKVNPGELDQKFAYIQVTHVTPYFEEKELQKRITEFERNNNIKRFMFETPFTKAGKARGEIHEQFKRRTILITSHSFPYMKKRIEVVKKTDSVLHPIEVAIDEMQSKVVDIREVVNLSRPDLKNYSSGSRAPSVLRSTQVQWLMHRLS